MIKSVDKQMDELFKSDEWEPTDDDKNWKTDGDLTIMTTFNTSINFKIDSAFIESMQKFNDLYSKNQTYERNPSLNKYGRIYSITDDSTNKQIICYTSKTVLYATKLIVSEQLRTGKSVLKNLSSNIKNTTYSVKLLELVNIDNGTDILKTRKKYYEDKYDKNKDNNTCVPKITKPKITLKSRQIYAIRKSKIKT